jgi:hypothetical protein
VSISTYQPISSRFSKSLSEMELLIPILDCNWIYVLWRVDSI